MEDAGLFKARCIGTYQESTSRPLALPEPAMCMTTLTTMTMVVTVAINLH